MTTLQKINNLTWFSEIIKLKVILKELLTLATPTPTAEKIEYKALLNKTNFSGVTATELVNTLPDNITVAFNQTVSSGDFYTDIVITHVSTDKLLVPLYAMSGDPFDQSVKTYKYTSDPTETVVRFEFPLEDFQVFDNFPFNFEVFR